ncbi:MAG TPA: hypothetical protein VEB22_03735 [Phycisphaerales bacterium]|nr:hypothetical protein [Phycisphaerales bacterium]
MNIRQRLHAALFAAEFSELASLRAENAHLRVPANLAELRALAPDPWPPRPPARVNYRGRMSEDDIVANLAGTRDIPAVQAILAKLEAAVVAAGDAAGEAPREQVVYEGKVIVPAFTEPMRTHAAGGFDALARVLGELQDLTAVKPIAKEGRQ